MSEPVNPYAAPQQAEEAPQGPVPTGVHLASLSQRFAGRVVDSLGSLAVSVVALFTIGDGLDLFRNESPAGQLAAILIFFAYALPFNALQWWLIVSNGQSVGKKLAQTKIVRDDGAPVGFASGVVLREWLIAVFVSVPYIGRFIRFIDAIAIYAGDERKTLHDRIAGTKVIDISPTAGETAGETTTPSGS